MNMRPTARGAGQQLPQGRSPAAVGGQRLGTAASPVASGVAPRQGSGATLLGSQPSWAAGGKPSSVRPSAAAAPDPRLRPATGGDGAEAVVSFLQQAGLQQHADALLRTGFDDMETLQCIEDDDLREIGIPAYNAVKLRKKLQELHGTSGPMYLDDGHPVVAFLTDVGLRDYAELLLRHGFDDMETLCEIADSDMQDLGIKRGHAIKLRSRIREYSEGARVLRQQPRTQRSSQPKTLARPRATTHQPVSESTRNTVQHSWLQVQERGAKAVAELMPGYLFEAAPETMSLFPPQVREKYREWTAEEGPAENVRSVLDSPGLHKIFLKIVNTAGQAVAGLHNLDHLIPMLRQLGARHVGYGIHEEHLPAMGQALNRSLRACLGEAFSADAEYAWTTTFAFISAMFAEGMRAEQAARASEKEDGTESCCSRSTKPEPNEESTPGRKPADELLSSTAKVSAEDQGMNPLAGA